MNVLSLFDGCSGGQLALKTASIKYDKYYASEIEKNPIKVTMVNFPDTIQLGDIEKWKSWDIDFKSIDLVMGGSPCQGFSKAGKGLNFEDPRSKLFFVFVDILNHIKSLNPDVKFLLENVELKKEWENIVSKYLGINPITIDSSLVSAQSRKRNYWTNFSTKPYPMFGGEYCDISQPKDKNIYLKDILQPTDEIDEKYYISETALKRILNTKYSKPQINPEKTGTINTGNNSAKLCVDSGTTLITERGQGHSIDFNTSGKVPKCVRQLGRPVNNHKSRIPGQETEQIFESRLDNKSGTLTTVSKDNLILIPEATKKGFTEIAPGESFDFENPNSKTRRGRKMEDKSNALTTQNHFLHYTENYRIRRLTPLEVSRLQTIPDSFFFKDGKQIISDSAIYKACGNGWTNKVIVHILKYLKSK